MVASPFPLKQFIIGDWSQSSGICFLIINLIKSVITSSITSPPALTMSMTIPDKTHALPSSFLMLPQLTYLL